MSHRMLEIGELADTLSEHPSFNGGMKIDPEAAIGDAELGAIFREYVLESMHGSWEGFEPYHMTGVRTLLADFNIFMKSHRENDMLSDARVFPFDPRNF